MAKWPSVTVDTAEDFVLSNKAFGADFIKLMQVLNPTASYLRISLTSDQEDGKATGFTNVPVATLELQKAVSEAAHKHDLLVLAHATNLDATLTVLRAGTDGVAHGFRDQPPNAEVIDEFKRRNAFLIPTLVISCSSTAEEQGLREHFAAKATPDQLPEEFKANMLKPLGISKSRGTVENAYDLVRQLKAAGVDIVAVSHSVTILLSTFMLSYRQGTDAVPQLRGTAIGQSLKQELWQYVSRCGFTPVEALRSATSVTARRFRLADRGGIAEGLRADILVVKGDPSSDIEDLCNVLGVWKAGQVAYKAAEL